MNISNEYGDSNKMNEIRQMIQKTTPQTHLRTLVVNICDHCNLNCVNCDHFSPIAKERFISTDDILNDLARIYELLGENIDRIAIMGGEPLLHPEVCDILSRTRDVFPTVPIWLSTNGMLLKNKPVEFWKMCHERNITLSVTKYPIRLDYDNIEKTAILNEVKYFYISGNETEKTSYHIPLDPNGKQDTTFNFTHCFHANDNCNMLMEGRLFPCTVAPNMHIFEEKYNCGISLTSDDGVNIYSVRSGKELLEQLSHPIPACRFCDVKNRSYGHKWDISKGEMWEWVTGSVLDQIDGEYLLDLYNFAENLKSFESIYIYGSGMVGTFLYRYLQKKGVDYNVRAFLSTNWEAGRGENEGVPIYPAKSVRVDERDVVILAAKRHVRNELRSECKRLKIKNVLEIDVLDDIDYDYCSSIIREAYPTVLKRWYRNLTGQHLNLNNPKSFNEKINWKKINEKDSRKTVLADKYLVRDYVRERIGEQYLIPLLGVWDRFDDIDFNTLPNSFVLKCNHGCRWNVIVKDKRCFDIRKNKKAFDEWMSMNYAFQWGFEMHYSEIDRKIIAEEYIKDSENEDIPDYKFFCFDGKVKLIQYDYDRFTDHKRNLYTCDWEYVPGMIMFPTDPEAIVKKPEGLAEMIEIAEKLSHGFNHVRVDLYYCDGKVYFGEMTFSHGSGTERFEPIELGYQLGSYMRLEENG